MRIELMPGGYGTHAYQGFLVRLAPERFSRAQMFLHRLPFGIGRRALLRTRPPVEVSCLISCEDGELPGFGMRSLAHSRLGGKADLACPECGHAVRVEA